MLQLAFNHSPGLTNQPSFIAHVAGTDQVFSGEKTQAVCGLGECPGIIQLLNRFRTTSRSRLKMICSLLAVGVKAAMQFLRRNQFFLLTLAVALFSSVMAVRQFQTNASAHAERLEDFILLQEQDNPKLAERPYQLLVQELPDLSERALVEDLQRTAMLVDAKSPKPDSLLWKYHIGVRNELRKRSERRLHRILEQAGVS